MQEEQLLTIQQYATKHKMSTFAVIKCINAKMLKIIKKPVDGKEQEFIVDESIVIQTPQQNVLASKKEVREGSIDYEREFHALLAKYITLQEKYTALIEEKNAKE